MHSATRRAIESWAQFYLGLLYHMQNDFKLAISPLQTAQTLSPKNPLPVFYLAITQEARGDEAKALAVISEGGESFSRGNATNRRNSRHMGSCCFHWEGPRRVLKKLDEPLRQTQVSRCVLRIGKGVRPQGRPQERRARRRASPDSARARHQRCPDSFSSCKSLPEVESTRFWQRLIWTNSRVLPKQRRSSWGVPKCAANRRVVKAVGL